jgi:ribosome maturation factor RimP
MNPRERELFDLLSAGVASAGVDLVEVVLVPTGRRPVIRLVIHGASGVTHGDCSRVTRLAGDILEDHEAVPGSYTLEVSSPGTDRHLREGREFEVFRGRRVRLWRDEDGQVSEHTGLSGGTRGEEEVVLVGDDGEETVIPWTSVKKARLVPEQAGIGGTGGRER